VVFWFPILSRPNLLLFGSRLGLTGKVSMCLPVGTAMASGDLRRPRIEAFQGGLIFFDPVSFHPDAAALY